VVHDPANKRDFFALLPNVQLDGRVKPGHDGGGRGNACDYPSSIHSCAGSLWNFHVRFGPAITFR
jgi:hypothetical protein